MGRSTNWRRWGATVDPRRVPVAVHSHEMEQLPGALRERIGVGVLKCEKCSGVVGLADQACEHRLAFRQADERMVRTWWTDRRTHEYRASWQPPSGGTPNTGLRERVHSIGYRSPRCRCRQPSTAHRIGVGPPAAEPVVQCESCGSWTSTRKPSSEPRTAISTR